MRALTLVLAACTSGRAGTLYGPSGLILNPTAEVAQPLSVSVGASTFEGERPTRHLRWASVTAAFGLGHGAEVGATYLRLSGTRDGDGGGVFAKYQIVPASLLTPAVAVGGGLIGGQQVRTRDAYLVATKAVRPLGGLGPLRLSGGAAYSWYRDGSRRRDWDAMAGLSLPLAGGLSLAGEWRSRTKGHPEDQSGAMLIYSGRGYGIGAGVLHNGWGDAHESFIGVGFNVSTLD
ncbi:MAG: hypothetical protein AB1505_15925 [Candidatus Latescibacterota bacterium]